MGKERYFPDFNLFNLLKIAIWTKIRLYYIRPTLNPSYSDLHARGFSAASSRCWSDESDKLYVGETLQGNKVSASYCTLLEVGCIPFVGRMHSLF